MKLSKRIRGEVRRAQRNEWLDVPMETISQWADEVSEMERRLRIAGELCAEFFSSPEKQEDR